MRRPENGCIRMSPVKVLAPESRRVPRPVLEIPPGPLSAPVMTASTTAEPSSTWRVRTVLRSPPRAIGLAKVSVPVAVGVERISAAPAGRKPLAPQVSGAAAPPRLTVRLAPTAAKPPVPVNWTWPAAVPTERAKSPEASSTAPPAKLRLSRPPVAPRPPGRALSLARRTTPPSTRVWPE